MNFVSLIKWRAKKAPHSPAVIDGDQCFSYTDLWRAISAAGRELQKRGAGVGGHVLIILPNGVDFLIYHFAAMKIGAVSVPVKPEYREFELSAIIGNCEPDVFVTRADWFAENCGNWLFASEILFADQIALDSERVVEEAVVTVRGSNPASINYSYFGDGYPKGAVLSHANHVYAASGYSRFMEFGPHDRFLILLPMSHVFTLSGCINSAFITGGCLVMGSGVSPKSILAAVEKFGITILTGVPPIFELLVGFKRKEKYNLSTLHLCVTGGEYMHEEMQARFEEEYKIRIVQGYGLTESLPVICNPRRGVNKHGTLGIPGRKDIAIRIVDGTGQALPPEKEGEVKIKSPTNMLYYCKLPSDTEKILDSEGWLATGDMGSLDADGYLRFHGLKKNLINMYGNKVDPLEVRRLMLSHPSVADAKVYLEEEKGNKRELSVKKICANIIPIAGSNPHPAEIAAFMQQKIASYKIPSKMYITPL